MKLTSTTLLLLLAATVAAFPARNVRQDDDATGVSAGSAGGSAGSTGGSAGSTAGGSAGGSAGVSAGSSAGGSAGGNSAAGCSGSQDGTTGMGLASSNGTTGVGNGRDCDGNDDEPDATGDDTLGDDSTDAFNPVIWSLNDDTAFTSTASPASLVVQADFDATFGSDPAGSIGQFAEALIAALGTALETSDTPALLNVRRGSIVVAILYDDSATQTRLVQDSANCALEVVFNGVSLTLAAPTASCAETDDSRPRFTTATGGLTNADGSSVGDVNSDGSSGGDVNSDGSNGGDAGASSGEDDPSDSPSSMSATTMLALLAVVAIVLVIVIGVVMARKRTQRAKERGEASEFGSSDDTLTSTGSGWTTAFDNGTATVVSSPNPAFEPPVQKPSAGQDYADVEDGVGGENLYATAEDPCAMNPQLYEEPSSIGNDNSIDITYDVGSTTPRREEEGEPTYDVSDGSAAANPLYDVGSAATLRREEATEGNADPIYDVGDGSAVASPLYDVGSAATLRREEAAEGNADPIYDVGDGSAGTNSGLKENSGFKLDNQGSVRLVSVNRSNPLYDVASAPTLRRSDNNEPTYDVGDDNN